MSINNPEILDLAFSPEPEDTPEDIERFKYFREFLMIEGRPGMPALRSEYVVAFNTSKVELSKLMIVHGRLHEDTKDWWGAVLDEQAFISGFVRGRLSKKGCTFHLRWPWPLPAPDGDIESKDELNEITN